MNWQIAVVVVAVGLAIAYLARSAWRTWNVSKGGCGGGCGCSKASESDNGHVTLIPADSLHVRRPDSRSG